MSRAARRLVCGFFSALPVCLAACAAEAPPAAAPAEMRVVVRLVKPSTDANAIARRASQSAGVPVLYRAAISPQWHALGLGCADDTRCTEALQRLRADTEFFDTVERDERRHPHANPS